MFHAAVRLSLVVVIALLLLASACGGVEGEPNLAKAVERTEATGSSRIEVRATLVEGGRTLAVRCDGAADYGRKRLRLACNSGFGEMIAIGDTLYITSDAFGVRVDKRWVTMPLDETDSLSNFSPERLLRMLRDASLETVRLGEETVREVPVVRYRLTVNCEEAQIGCPGTTAPVDVWIDDGGLVRRIELEDDGSPGTIEFYDFGDEVDIEPPPADQISGIGQCSKGEAKPISESQALEALRRHGFSVRRAGDICDMRVAAVITNAPQRDAGDVLAREGIIHCFLHERPESGAPKTVVRRGVDGGDAELVLANLTCSILADSPNAEEKIRPLEQAFEELERAIRP